MFRTLIYPTSGTCDYSVELPLWSYCSWFDVCWSFGVAGLEWYSCCRLKHNTDTTPNQPHRNSNTHRTKNNTTNVVIKQNSRKLLMMDILMSETFWAHKKWNKITSGIKLVFYSSNVFFFLNPSIRSRVLCRRTDLTEQILCSVDRASLYNLFQMKPTRCTLLLSIFISTSVHVSGNYVPIIRRTYCIYATLVYCTLYGWLSGLQTRQPSIHSEKYQCRIDTVSSPDDGHIVARNMYRSWNKYTMK